MAAEWEVQKAAYEEQIRSLAVQLEQEKQGRAEDARKTARTVRQLRAEFEAKAEEERRSCQVEVAAAKARAKEAQEMVEVTARRVDEDLAAVRQQADARVAEMRRESEARIRACEEQRRADLQAMQQQLDQQRRACERAVQLNERAKDTALEEKQRHMEAIERECREERVMKEADFSVKEARLEEWRDVTRRQNKEAAERARDVLELEKTLHARTMERTMGRVARHLRLGDGDIRGNETPTRGVLRRAVLEDVPWLPETPRGGRRKFGLVGEAVVDGPGSKSDEITLVGLSTL